MYTALPKLSRNLSPSCRPSVAAFCLRKVTTRLPGGADLRLRYSRCFLLSSANAAGCMIGERSTRTRIAGTRGAARMGVRVGGLHSETTGGLRTVVAEEIDHQHIGRARGHGAGGAASGHGRLGHEGQSGGVEGREHLCHESTTSESFVTGYRYLVGGIIKLLPAFVIGHY